MTVYLRFEHVFYAIKTAWQSDTTSKENDQYNVWESSCEVDSLRTKIQQLLTRFEGAFQTIALYLYLIPE